MNKLVVIYSVTDFCWNLATRVIADSIFGGLYMVVVDDWSRSSMKAKSTFTPCGGVLEVENKLEK